jgi:hypothetical protein
MLADRLDIFSRRYRTQVHAGATYSRRTPDHAIETAQVHSVGKDGAGIDHVRFHIQISRGETKVVDEDRILSLRSFAERFRDFVQA